MPPRQTSRRWLSGVLVAATAAMAVAGAAPAAGQEPAAGQTPAAQVLPDARLLYQVQPGDTLEQIAATWLDTPLRWIDVARLNHVPEPRRLQPGTLLRFLPEWLKSGLSEGWLETVGGHTRVDDQRAASGASISEGSLIETDTDGIAVVRLADGTRLRIPPASRVRVERLRNYHGEDAIEAWMRLERGAIEPVSPPNRRRPLDVRTPAGNAAVRGTDFRVRTDAGTDFVEVISGAVDAGSGIGRAMVGGGVGAAFSTSHAPRLERLLPAPDLRNLSERVFTETRPVIALPVVPRARSWRVDVARDAGFTDLLLSTRVDIPEIRVATREDGPLYLRLSGVSDLGINGLAAVARIAIQARPVAPRPLSPGADDVLMAGPIELRWQPAGPDEQYRIQIADDDRFERLLADTVHDGNMARIVLPPGGDAVRYWRIAAIDRTTSPSTPRQGPFSAAQSFRQRAPEAEDRAPPRTIVLPDGDGYPDGNPIGPAGGTTRTTR